MKVKLSVLDFGGSLTSEEIEKIGKDYVHQNLCLVDEVSKNPIPFCKTIDGKWVYFKSPYLKLIGRKINGIRLVEASRVRRLTWIIPVIEEEADERILRGDFDGVSLAKRGHQAIPGTIYRIYWVPTRKYVVWLVPATGKRGDTTFNLVSAYRVSEPSTEATLETLFRHKK